MGKHINTTASKTIARVHKQHQGVWNDIMADPAIRTLGFERHTLQTHVSYLKRKSRTDKENYSATDSFCSSSASSSEEEFELMAITARKKGIGNIPTKWYAVYSDGDERWLPQNCFVDIDGTANTLFVKFQEDHPENNDVKLLPKVTKKRSLMDELEEKNGLLKKTKLNSVEPEKPKTNKILLKMLPSSPLHTTTTTTTINSSVQHTKATTTAVEPSPVAATVPIEPPLSQPTKKVVCLEMMKQIVEEDSQVSLLRREVGSLRREIGVMKHTLDELAGLIRQFSAQQVELSTDKNKK